MSDTVLTLLQHYRTFKENCKIIISDSDCIFTGCDGEIIVPSRYAKIWREFLREKCQINEVPLKNARHSSDTFYIQDSSNLVPIENRFGHSKIETTMKFYNQASHYEDQKLVNKFDESFRN